MVVGLAIVLAVVYGVYWLLKKRYRGGTRGGAVADGRLEIVATTALAGNRAVHLLRAGDELFLIGSSEQSVTGLRSWGPEEARRLEAVLAMPPPSRAAADHAGRHPRRAAQADGAHLTLPSSRSRTSS